MNWRRTGYGVALGSLALLVLALTWLWTADLGVFKPQVERFLSREIGREFSIEGRLSIDLASQATVIAEGVRIANAAWAEPEDMVRVGRAEIRVDLWSLVSGPVVIDRLDLDDAAIRLVDPGDTDPNWVLPAKSEAERKGGSGAIGVPVLFRRVEVDRVNVRLDSVRRERPLELALERLDLRHREDDFLALELRGTLGGRRLAVDGEAGTWDRLLAGRDIAFELDAMLDTLAVSGRGRIDDVASPRRPRVDFTARGPDIDDLTRMLALGAEGEGDIELVASLTPRPEGPVALELEGHLGRTEIDASGTVADLQGLEDLEFRATSSGPDLGRILRVAGIRQLREAPFSAQVDLERRGGAFIVNEARLVVAGAEFEGTARLPNFPTIDHAVVRAEVAGPDLEQFRFITGMPGAATGPFSATLAIDAHEGGQEVAQLNVSTSLGELRADAKVANADTFVGSEVEFRLHGASLAGVARAYRLPTVPEGPFEFAGTVEYTPDGIRTRGPLRATLDVIAAQVEGLVALGPELRGTDLDIRLEGASLAGLVGGFADASAIPKLPYAARGRMQVGHDGLRFRDVNGSLGASAIRAKGLVVVPGIAGSRVDVEVDGPAFEELFERMEGLEVRPGPYELAARIAFHPEVIDVRDLRLDREAVDLRLDLEVGLPISRRWLGFELRARGRDVRGLPYGMGGFEWREQPFSARVDGNLRDTRLTVDKLDIEVGPSTIVADGDIDFAEARGTTAFNLELDLPNLAALGTIGGREFREQAASLSARIVGDRGRLESETLQLQVGESEVRGTVAWRAGEVPALEVSLVSDELVLASLLEAPAEGESTPPAPEAGPPAGTGRLIPDVALPFEAMRALDASIELDVRRLQRGALLIRDLVLDAQLDGGVLEIPVAGFTARSGRVRGRARLDPAAGAGAASLELVARDFAPGISEMNRDTAMTGDLDVRLRGTGNDLRALAGSLNGVVFADIRGGRIANNRALQRLYGSLLEEILSTINPFREEEPYTELKCAIVSARLKDGVWTGAPNSFVSTDKIRIVTRSRIDLKTEAIRIGIRTTPKGIVSISAAELINPYLQVGGTLARPRLAVDETGVLITGGAAVATGGLSIIAEGLWNRLSRSGDACGRAAEAAIAEIGDRFPDLAIDETGRDDR